MTWEKRWHPLREEWVIIAAHRNDRPWIGLTIQGASHKVPIHDPECAFCPGNRRVSGKVNPLYDGVFAFDNDHPCVGPKAPVVLEPTVGIFRNASAQGLARVLCYDPRHDRTLAELALTQVTALFAEWQHQFRELGDLPGIRHVLIFENKGECVGVSNPHPHCQIYATDFVFKTIENEVRIARRYWREHRRSLVSDIVASEHKDARRIISENDSAVAFVPYFARYAYESFVVPKETHASLATLSQKELEDLAAVTSDLLIRFDNLWEMSFPYVLALHQAPIGEESDGFHFHIEIHPPLRKPHLVKHLAGPEIGGGTFLSDTCAEEKAKELQSTSPIHYKNRASL